LPEKTTNRLFVDAVNILMTEKPADMKIWTDMLNIDEGYLEKYGKDTLTANRGTCLFFLTRFWGVEYYNNVYEHKVHKKSGSKAQGLGAAQFST